MVWMGRSDWDINNTVFRWWWGKVVILFILIVKNFLRGFSLSQLPWYKDRYKTEGIQIYKRHSTNTAFFFSLETWCMWLLIINTQQCCSNYLFSWILKFIFTIVLNTFRKYPSKPPFILVDRSYYLLLVKYSEYFFRSSLNLFIFQGEISLLFWKITTGNYHLDHIHCLW